MSRARRFAGGLGSGYLQQALILLVGLWLTPFLLDRLGEEPYGLWLVAIQLLGYLGLFDFGVSGVLPRQVAASAGERAGSPDPQLLRAGRRLMLKQGALATLCAVALWAFMPATWQGLRPTFAWLLAAIPLTFVARYAGAVLQGLQDYAFLGAAQAVAWATGTALGITLVFNGWALQALAWGWLVTQLVAAALLAARLRRRQLPSGDHRGTMQELEWTLLRSGGWVSLSQLGYGLLAGSDLLIIGKLLGPAAVVPYSCTTKLINVLNNQPHLVALGAVPTLSEARAGGDWGRLRSVVSSISLATVLLSGGIACVVLLVNRGFVTWWVGPERWAGLGLTAAAALHMVLRHALLPLSAALFACGHERRLATLTFIDGLVSVTASLLMVPRLGLLGAALGPLAGLLLVTAPALIAVFLRELRPVAADLRAALAPWAWRAALLGGAALMVAARWLPNGLAATAAAALLGAGVYAVSMMTFVRRPPLNLHLRALAPRKWLGLQSWLGGGAPAAPPGWP